MVRLMRHGEAMIAVGVSGGGGCILACAGAAEGCESCCAVGSLASGGEGKDRIITMVDVLIISPYGFSWES